MKHLMQSCTRVRAIMLVAAAAVLCLPLAAETVLIDYDDGVPGNGLHEASIRNGGFEDADGSNFASTPFWDSYFSEGEAADPVFTDQARSGALRAQTSGWAGTGIRAHLSQVIPSTDWTIAAADSFTLKFWARAGTNLDKFDEAQVIIDVVDSGGNPVQQGGTSQLFKQNSPVTRDGGYSLITAVTPPIPAGSAHIGHQLRFRILAEADRNEFIIIDDVTLTTNAATLPAATLPATPNIVLIYADDVGYGDVSAYGSGIVATPRINSIAEEGIRFTDAHSPASTCTPSRYSMLTGEYAWRTPGTGIASGVSKLLVRAGSVTLPSMLQEAGYETAAVGKWHLGLGSSTTDYNANPISPGPREIGFDYWFGIPATNDRVPCVYMENSAIANLDAVNDPLLVSYSSEVGDEPTGAEAIAAGPEPGNLLSYYTSDGAGHNKTIINGISRIGWMDGGVAARWIDEDHADIFDAKAGTFIAANAAAGQPFFLYFASPDIHVPRAPHQRFQGVSPHGWRGDAMLQLDWNVGALLDRLADPNGDGSSADSIVENTLVIFTSDNGPVGNDGYNDGSGSGTGVTEFADGHDSNAIFTGGKYSIREGGTRVPFLVQWPGTIPAGITSDALLSATDLMASFSALIGQALPTDAGPDSENVLPALLGQSPTARSILITQNNNQNPKGVRRDNWKLLSNDNSLYNLDNDPDESNNVASSNTAIGNELQAILAASEANPMLSPLLAWWPFDDASGTAARDISGFDQAAALTGSPSWATDAGLPHLHFDGFDDSAEIPALPMLDGDFTLATWARSSAASFSTAGALLSRRPAFALAPVAATGQLQFIVYSGPATPQTLTLDLATIPGFDLTDWHHYAASYEAATGIATLYIDGTEQAAASFTAGAANSDTGSVFLGSDEGAASFAGDLSDTRIYASVLSPQRVANTASARLDDSDTDGMLSDWEHRYTLDPFNPADAAGDLDSDSISNLEEFNANSSPIIPDSVSGGLIAHWPLDETSGTTASDVSGSGHPGSLINNPAWTAGPGRRFLSFNGSNQYVDVTTLPDLNAQVTAACWARSDNSTWNVAGTLISRRPQFILHPWLNNTRLSFLVTPAGGSETGAEIYLNTIPGFDLTDWHHYAGTYDAATGAIRLYVDGILRGTKFVTPALLTSTTDSLHLGRDVGRSRYLAGDIDDAIIFNRTLDATGIVGLVEGYDDDQDGLDDAFERQLIEASPAYTTLADVSPSDDPDSDGSDNLAESIAGTDPLDPADRLNAGNFQIVENEGSRSFSINIDGRAGRSYTLYQSPDLTPPWSPIESIGPLTSDQVITLTHPEIPPARAFYRVEVSYTP